MHALALFKEKCHLRLNQKNDITHPTLECRMGGYTETCLLNFFLSFDFPLLNLQGVYLDLGPARFTLCRSGIHHSYSRSSLMENSHINGDSFF